MSSRDGEGPSSCVKKLGHNVTREGLNQNDYIFIQAKPFQRGHFWRILNRRVISNLLIWLSI